MFLPVITKYDASFGRVSVVAAFAHTKVGFVARAGRWVTVSFQQARGLCEKDS
jgi:hypothetical protein